jgi:hypothetical protein
VKFEFAHSQAAPAVHPSTGVLRIAGVPAAAVRSPPGDCEFRDSRPADLLTETLRNLAASESSAETTKAAAPAPSAAAKSSSAFTSQDRSAGVLIVRVSQGAGRRRASTG